jgi:hypothetical protein
VKERVGENLIGEDPIPERRGSTSELKLSKDEQMERHENTSEQEFLHTLINDF